MPRRVQPGVGRGRGRRLTLLTSVLLACAASVAGCGSDDQADASSSPSVSIVATEPADPAALVDNGLADLDADEALVQARAALTAASSYRVTGSPSPGAPLDLVFVAGDDTDDDVRRGSKGTLTQQGSTFSIRAVDGSVYVRGELDWLVESIGQEAIDTIGNKWLLLSDPVAESVALFTDPDLFAEATLTSSGRLRPLGVSIVDDRPVVGVQFVDTESIVWLSGTGEPYPVLLERLGATAAAGVLAFSEFDADVTLKAPLTKNVLVVDAESDT